MARYRLLQTSYIKQHPNAAYEQLLGEGVEITYLGVPGPHMEPLDDAARAAMAEYRAKHPKATLNPTGSMSGTFDPIAGPSVEQMVQAQLERMEASLRAKADAPAPDLAAAFSKLAESQAQMTTLLATLVQALAPAPNKKAS